MSFPPSARVASVLLFAGLIAAAYVKTRSSVSLTDSANAFLSALTPEQQAKARFTFADDERLNWHFIPKERKGLALREMTPTQKHLAYALLSNALSSQGFTKATQIMSLEDILRIMEKDSGERRNPEKYYFSLFGEPAEKGMWGVRVEGHHLSLNLTVVDGKISGSPNFFGTNPAEVREGPRKGLRVLHAEEDLGRDLLAALTPEQKAVAIVSKEAYKDILTMAERKASISGQPNGLSAAKMNARQRELLQRLVEEYTRNLPEDVAAAREELVRKAGTNLYFAWAGVEERGGPHYYRVAGPDFLIEYDNTQNNANHVHSVWREYKGDWGEDMLAQHYKSSHK
ncbi:MAG TPA: DUF3500 domain-containing protein [Bryobacteraceae bacterium]|nr:DUF3500 domain-containing protein [Bryobacteraceae bacterium]